MSETLAERYIRIASVNDTLLGHRKVSQIGNVMQVLQTNKYYYPQVGGIEEVVRAIADGLSQRGHQVSVLASKPRGVGEQTKIAEVPVRKTTSFGPVQSVPLSPTYPFWLANSSSDVDLVHHHLPNPLGVVSHFATNPYCSTVVTYHSDIVRQSRALKLYAPILRAFLRRVDHIMVTSPGLLKSSPILRPYQEKCSVVPLSIDLHNLPSPVRPPDFPVAENEQFVLFAGRLNYYKGVEYLIEASTRFDAPVVIAGDGDRSEKLKRKSVELGLSDQIHFLGYVSDEMLHYCYEHASTFVLPSVERSEAFGLVQLEAMAHSTPVINTNLQTGVPWVSQDGKTGLTVPPRDTGALGDAIYTLLNDDALREKYGTAARKRVEANFTRPQMISSIEQVYENVAVE